MCKKTSEKFVSSEKSITFASAIERDAPKRKWNIRASESRKVYFYAECSRICRLDSEGIQAEIAQLVEHNLAKVGVAGPSPVFRSLIEQKRALGKGLNETNAQVAELVDAHVSGACAARRAGSSPVLGTLFYSILTCWRGGGIGRRATLRG